MVAQMSVVSMFALFAKETYALDALHAGFAMTLGAIASIGTNIWISPVVQHSFGDVSASIMGCGFLILGSIVLVHGPLSVSLVGLMIVYLGMAINGGAVASGTANLTDAQNRATVMMGARMLKSAGAVCGPLASGMLSVGDCRMPFFVAACSALLAATWQVATIRLKKSISNMLRGRRAVGLDTGLLEGEGWQDEYGTPQEIQELGEFVANLLTKRHYRWVTYNQQLKNCLDDFFPPLPVQSDDEHRAGYDLVRNHARYCASHALMVQERN
eukprot:gnl/MRDRNA2_/MRDRNA2_267159_c0_seq1.p1 gnl/MRDRNA2_/MRDRNA2_267159_c0~~gnl/MRDRNA2_/MRDRNA2_267159_c0_seq1.p1  ORF type:complete len:293 (-),score=39.21 gnl/MRDRNA2_/MRDRNA2_267159_c0_seq1:118-930(-)